MDTEQTSSAVDRYLTAFRTDSCDLSVKRAVFTTFVDLFRLLVMQYDREYPDCPNQVHNVVGLSPQFHKMIGSSYPSSLLMGSLDSYLLSKGTSREAVIQRVDHDVEIIAQRCIDVLAGRTTLDRLECMLDLDGA